MRTIRRPRATIRVGPTETVKTFHDPETFCRELGWYLAIPWAVPELVDHDITKLTLTVRSYPVAIDLRWRPVRALYELLKALHDLDLHHRDVHVKNVVRGPQGPLLVDLETMIRQPSELSYDLYGPDSGVPVPEIHQDHYPQWWGAKNRMSIGVAWRADVPTEVG